jgi:phage protein D
MSDPPEEMTVPGILKKVFKDHGFDDVTPALTGSYRTLDHCVQYRETDFNFVSRLMEQEGIYYFSSMTTRGAPSSTNSNSPMPRALIQNIQATRPSSFAPPLPMPPSKGHDSRLGTG